MDKNIKAVLKIITISFAVILLAIFIYFAITIYLTVRAKELPCKAASRVELSYSFGSPAFATNGSDLYAYVGTDCRSDFVLDFSSLSPDATIDIGSVNAPPEFDYKGTPTNEVQEMTVEKNNYSKPFHLPPGDYWSNLSQHCAYSIYSCDPNGVSAPKTDTGYLSISERNDTAPTSTDKFDFKITGQINFIHTAFMRSDNGDTGFYLPTGQYTLSEIVPSDWPPSDAKCFYLQPSPTDISINNGIATFTIQKNQHVACTFTNIKRKMPDTSRY